MTSRRAAVAIFVPIAALGLTACSGGGSAGENAAKDAYGQCDGSAVADYLVRDGNRVRIVIEDDPSDLTGDEQDTVLALYSCILDATGYGGSESDISDGDAWGRWTYTEDSDGNVTWTAAD